MASTTGRAVGGVAVDVPRAILDIRYPTEIMATTCACTIRRRMNGEQALR